MKKRGYIFERRSTATGPLSESVNQMYSAWLRTKLRQKSGYNFKLQYSPQPSKPKRSRSRNVIWLNPPYNSTISRNIGYKFLQAVDDCFTPDHPLRKIFNRNTLKLCYSRMPNVESIIFSHNKFELKGQSVTSASQVDKIATAERKIPALSLVNA